MKVLDWGQDGHERTMKHREAFEKEVTVWQNLDHPNVTKVPPVVRLNPVCMVYASARNNLDLNCGCTSLWARRWERPS